MITPTSIGDLARSVSLRTQVTRLKTDLNALTQELATGYKNDLGKTVQGDFDGVAELERTLGALGSYQTAVREGSLLLDAAQVSLTHVHDALVDHGPTLVFAADVAAPSTLSTAGSDARQALSSAVASLNLSVAGRAIFAGTSTDKPPLISGEDILSELSSTLPAGSSAADAIAYVEDWFLADGGGFETFAYQGSDQPMTSIPIGAGETADFSITAADPALRRTFAAFAMAALVNDGAFHGQPDAQTTLLKTAGQMMMTVEADVADLQADVGARQAVLDTAKSRISTSQNAYQSALSDIYAADPYEIATRLESATLQLESLYAVTSRLSNLSMTEYLR